MDLGVEAPVVVVGLGSFGSEGDGVGEAEGLEDGVVDVATHISECSGSII